MTEQLNTAARHGLTTTDKLRMLLDITKKISRSLDLQEVLNLVMDTLDSLIPYDAAGIFLIECGDKELVPEAEEPCNGFKKSRPLPCARIRARKAGKFSGANSAGGRATPCSRKRRWLAHLSNITPMSRGGLRHGRPRASISSSTAQNPR